MTNLNDSLDDIFGAPSGEVRIEPIRAPADYKPREFSEPCPKCRGTGRYNAPSSHGSHCFACKGKGKKTFRTSPEARAKARTSTNARKARIAAEAAAARDAAALAWAAANPVVYAELQAGASRDNGFCISLLSKLAQWGSLTDGQVAGVLKGMEKRAAAQAAAADRVANAPAADAAGVDRLKLAFDTAIQRARDKGLTIRTPKITIAGTTISPAKSTSSNPGALYVKNGGTYLGKITGGRFFASRECQSDEQAKILEFIADPKAAAEAYGQTTGVCCVCNATLKSKWKLRGIGPICAEKMGWAGE